MEFSTNDIIVPSGFDYPNRAMRVISWDGQRMTAYPEGGGMHYAFDKDAVIRHGFKVVKIDQIKPQWRKAMFQIEDGPEFEGYHFGKRWNGWACPMFTIEVMREISEWLCGEWMTVDGNTVTHISPDEEETDSDEGSETEREGIPTMRLYSFDGWCWDEVTE